MKLVVPEVLVKDEDADAFIRDLRIWLEKRGFQVLRMASYNRAEPGKP